MRNRRFTGCSVVLLAASLAACEGMPLLAPANSTITVSAATQSLPPGGSTEVSAFVAEPSGTPVQNGTLVRFTTTLGRVDPVEAETRNGRAVTTFFAGNQSGVADVRATSGGGVGSTGGGSTGSTTTPTASNLVQISVGVVDSISIRANPAVVPSTGGTVDVIATVRGTAGPISGMLVSFSATAGTLESGSALTDDNGEARTRLTTNVTATVNATAGGKTTAAGATVTAQAAVESVTVRVNPAVVSTSGGTVDVVATVISFTGRPAVGMLVSFSSTAGTLNPPTALTDDNGEARSRLTTTATATVTATAGGKTSAGATVTAQAGPSVTLTCSIAGSGNCTTATVGQSVTFAAARGATTSLIRSATLDFGDGSSLDLGTLASPVTVSHSYGAVGSYTARLTATDVNGETTSVVQPVQILAPVAVSLALSKAGATVTGTATVSGGVGIQYEWTFDGSTPNVITTSNTASFTYSSSPVGKTVTVRVIRGDGRSATASAQVPS
jgi:adhesin/invasin